MRTDIDAKTSHLHRKWVNDPKLVASGLVFKNLMKRVNKPGLNLPLRVTVSLGTILFFALASILVLLAYTS